MVVPSVRRPDGIRIVLTNNYVAWSQSTQVLACLDRTSEQPTHVIRDGAGMNIDMADASDCIAFHSNTRDPVYIARACALFRDGVMLTGNEVLVCAAQAGWHSRGMPCM